MDDLMAAVEYLAMNVRFGDVLAQLQQADLNHLLDGQRHGQGSFHLQAAQLGALAVFPQRPDLFQHLVELLLVAEREGFLLDDAAVVQFYAALRQPRHHRIMRHHDDSAALAVKVTQQPQHDLFVESVEVAGGLIG